MHFHLKHLPMSLLKQILLCIIILQSITLQSQNTFQDGTLYLCNKDSIKTYIKVYDYDILQSKLKYEYLVNDELIKIKAKEISKITIGSKTYEKLHIVKKRTTSRTPSAIEIYDTVYFFATLISTSGPKVYAHYSCSLPFSYNGGCNSGTVNVSSLLTPKGNSYIRLSDYYFSDKEDPDLNDTPHLYNDKLNTYIYLKPHLKASNKTNTPRPGMRR